MPRIIVKCRYIKSIPAHRTNLVGYMATREGVDKEIAPDRPATKKQNDAAGIVAATRLTEILKEAGYDNVSRLFPECKDWNEQLVSLSFRDEPEEELVMSM